MLYSENWIHTRQQKTGNYVAEIRILRAAISNKRINTKKNDMPTCEERRTAKFQGQRWTTDHMDDETDDDSLHWSRNGPKDLLRDDDDYHRHMSSIHACMSHDPERWTGWQTTNLL